MKAWFCKTKDAKTAKDLENSGLKLLNYDGTFWTFVNNENKKFNYEKGEVIYTDKLTF